MIHYSVMGAGPRLSPVPIKNHRIRGSKNRPVVHPLQMSGWVKRKAALLLLRDLFVKDLLCLGTLNSSDQLKRSRSRE